MFIMCRRMLTALALIGLGLGLITQSAEATVRSRTGGLPPWRSCGVFTSKNKVIKSYANAYRRNIQLQCGGPVLSSQPGWGYRHIVWRHRDDFARLAVGTAQNWQDIADLGMASALHDPDVVGPKVDGKICFSRKIFLYNLHTGELVRSKIVRVVYKLGTGSIITAFPSRSQCAT